jgi:hypothetical protein
MERIQKILRKQSSGQEEKDKNVRGKGHTLYTVLALISIIDSTMHNLIDILLGQTQNFIKQARF